MHSKVFNTIPNFILDNESYIITKEAAILFKNLNEIFFSTMCINFRSLLNPNHFNKLEYLLSALEISLLGSMDYPYYTRVSRAYLFRT